MTQQQNDIEAAARRQPLYWFTRLELATRRGDMEEAAEAVRELQALGIEVRYRCRPWRRTEVARGR